MTSASHQPPAVPLDMLLISMGGETYALPSSSVREVIRYREYTPVPGAPPILPGILSQRGLILPIVNAYPLLGLSAPSVSRATRLVIITHHDVDLALLVEAVHDLAVIDLETIEPLPVALDPARARFLRGLVHANEQLVPLLDLGELIASVRA